MVPLLASHLTTAGLPHSYYLDNIMYSMEGFLRYFGDGFFKGKEMGYCTKLIKGHGMILLNDRKY
jgi:hypothetical protein